MCREQYSKYTSCEFCEQVADAMSKSYALRKDRWPSWCVYDPEYEKMQKELENEQKKIDEACRFSESETLLSYMVRARIFLTLDGNFLNKNFLRGEP
jgi:hypothetical protein